MKNASIRKTLKKIVPSPYFDWGGWQLLTNSGYAKGSWPVNEDSRERMFVFHKDIEFAKECLRHDYEEPTEFNAILKLCGSRRTGNRRFPRFGWVFPQQCSIIGREEFLKHHGKSSAWQSLYALVVASQIDGRLKTSILEKIDNMEKCGESKKRIFSGALPKYVRVRNHYQVCFSPKEMEAVLPILRESAVPVQKFSTQETDLQENCSDKDAPEFGQSSLAQFQSTLKQKEIVDALSVIYRKFPEPAIRSYSLFAGNREFWECYDKLKHGVKGLEIENLSAMVAHTLSKMTKFRGKDGQTFFTGRTKIAENGAITYIDDFGFIPEVREYYNKKYLPRLKPRKFVNKGGHEVLTADGFEYADTFAASLFKAMFGNGKGYGISGPVERLVKYANDMKTLAKGSPILQKTLPELSHFRNSAKNLLLLLSDLSPNDVKSFQKEYCTLAYAIFVSIFPDALERYDFIEDSSEFYSRNNVTDGREANHKFNSRYKFLDEFAFNNKRKPSFTNCAILDMALRNADMIEWSSTIIRAIYENAYGKKEETNGSDDGVDYKAKSDNFPIERLAGLTKRGKVPYNYYVDKTEKKGTIHLGNALLLFLEKYSLVIAPRFAAIGKLPKLTKTDNILILK